MDLTVNARMSEYYERFIELQEKLRKSEEERMKLEMKFNEMMQKSRDEEQVYYRRLRSQYKTFLEEDRKRQERNEKIVRTLERIETRIDMLTSKTERFKSLRRQYQSYLHRVSEPKLVESLPKESSQNLNPSDELFETDEQKLNEEKMEILDRYLESISSQRCKELIEKRKLESAQLEKLDVLKDRLNNRFDSTKAQSIAEDIMNSIYNRHYSKDQENEQKYTNSTNKVSFENNESTKSSIGDDEEYLPRRSHLQQVASSDDYKQNIDVTKVNKEFINSSHQLNKIENDIKEKEKRTFVEDTHEIGYVPSEEKKYEKNPESFSNDDKVLERINLFEDDISLDGLNSQKKSHLTLTETDDFVEIKNSGEHFNDEYNALLIQNKVNSNDNEKQELTVVDHNKKQKEHLTVIAENLSNVPKNDESYSQNNNLLIKKVDEVTLPEVRDEELNMNLNNIKNEETGETFITEKELKNKLEENINENEKPEQLIVSDNNEQSIQNSENHYQQGDAEIQYDENGQAIQYDENGQVIQYDENMVQYDESGQPIHYDEHGQPIQYDQNGQPIQYDQNGQPIQYDQNGQPIQYDQNGQPIQYDQNGQPIQYDQNGQAFQYDENGQPIYFDESGQQVQYDEQGQPIQYDEQGQPIQYDEQGQPIQYDVQGQPIQYDEQGQPIQYDENGQPIQYDENGQPIQYDENGQPIYFDESGQRVHYDEQGQLVQQYDENSQQYVENDENNQNLTQYDENGLPIQHDSNKGNLDDNKQVLNTENKHFGEEILPTDYPNQRVEDNADFDENQPKTNKILEMLDTDTESLQQNISKASNDSDFTVTS